MKNISKFKIIVFSISLLTFSLSAYAGNTILSGTTIFIDLNGNNLIDWDEPVGVLESGNKYTITLTPDQAEEPLYQAGKAKLVVYGAVNLVADQPYATNLLTVAEHDSTVSLTEKIFQSIGADPGGRLTNKITSKLAQIEDEMIKIRAEIPEFLAIQAELLNDPVTLLEDGGSSVDLHASAKSTKKIMKEDMRSHQKILLTASRTINKRINHLKKIAVGKNIPALTQALNAAVASGDIVDSSFADNVTGESLSLKTNLHNFWKRGSKQLTTSDSAIAIKDIEVSIEASVTVTSEYPYLPVSIDNKTAKNFLSLATFGATKLSIESLKNKGIEKWVNEQLALPYVANNHLRRTIELSKKISLWDYSESVEDYIADNDIVFNKAVDNVNQKVGDRRVRMAQMSAWFETALLDEDQLRHRVAYALSQILVASLSIPDAGLRGEMLSSYFDILTKHAFGNYRELLLDISLAPSMGFYLTYHGSKKEHMRGTATVYPDENYAREIMQLFSLGLDELNLDGTKRTDEQGNAIATYGQEDVNNLAKVFTGWDMQRNSHHYGKGLKMGGDMTHAMENTAEYHDFREKTVLGTTIPAGNDGGEDLAAVVDILMAHDNIAPFISKQLIMRLTMSNPTPAYVARVATVFNDNGQGIKGDLQAVTKAIYLDSELWEVEGPKKFKEPLLAYTEFLRAFSVQKLPVWSYGQQHPEVKDTIFFRNPTGHFGQGPSRAYSVFNFYDNDYIPNDTGFQSDGLYTPELQIQTDAVLISLNNKINVDLLYKEKNYLLKRYGTLTDIDVLRSKSKLFSSDSVDKFLLDCKDEYDVLEEVLEGSIDGTFNSFNKVSRSKDTTADEQGVTDRDRALKALIVALDNKLLSGGLSDHKKEAIFQAHKDNFYAKSLIRSGAPTAGIYMVIIRPVILAIVTSENFMVQE